MQSIELVSATETSEPVSLVDVKAYLRIGSGETDDDGMLTVMIKTARKMLEDLTGQALVPQVWRVTDDRLVKGSRVWAPRVPVASATFEVYSGAAWVALTDYSVALAEGRLVVLRDPASAPDNDFDGFRVTFTSTRTAANAPSQFMTAILELVSYWYDNRGDVGVYIPDKVRGLVQSFRLYRV